MAAEFNVGDIVLVYAEKTPRQMWKLARILEVYRSANGHIRSCKIKVQDGQVCFFRQLIAVREHFLRESWLCTSF